jgi:hypothetical protein
MSAPSFGILFGLTNSVVRPSTKRSVGVRFGARCRARLLMSNWCFSSSRLCGDGADATWAEQLCDGGEQVDGEDEEVAHEANVTHHCW